MFPEVITYIPTASIRRLPEGRMQPPFGDPLVLSIKITPFAFSRKPRMCSGEHEI